MPINTLQYADILQPKLDLQIVQGLVTSWMDDNAGEVIYDGGSTIKIPSISMQGLGDYDRDNGFVRGAVTLKYDTLEMTQDRGRTFGLDSMDVNETNFLANAAMVASEFQRTQVIPEVDSYRLSKLYSIAKKKSQVKENYTPTTETILAELNEQLRTVRDLVGSEEIIIMMTSITAGILADAMKDNRRLDVGNFKKGEVNITVKVLDESPILPTPSARFKTLYKSNDGFTPGQEAGGLVPDPSAKDINWIICPKRAAIGACKQSLLRIFEPKENQSADAWKIDYRKYHDMWVKPSNEITIYASTKP